MQDKKYLGMKLSTWMDFAEQIDEIPEGQI